MSDVGCYNVSFIREMDRDGPMTHFAKRLSARAGVVALIAFFGVAGLAGNAHGQDEFILEGKAWVQQPKVDPKTPEGQLQEVRRLIAQGDAEDAVDKADEWIEQYPNHPLMIEALLVRGDAKVADKNEYKALFDYERILREYPGTEQFNTALERELEIAKLYAAGMKRKLWGMRFVTADSEAEEIFIRTQERAPGSQIGETASMLLGDYYFDRGEMRRAVEAYSLFMINYPKSIRTERAMLRAIQASLASFKGPQFDATGLIEADRRLRQFKRQFPASAERIGADALLVRIDESQALKMLRQAQWYEGQEKKVSAVTMYQRVVQEHPRTAAARVSMEKLVAWGHPIVPPSSGVDVENELVTSDLESGDIGRLRRGQKEKFDRNKDDQKTLPNPGPDIPGQADIPRPAP
jgi:outer membrane protein assembly factor BamD (BamD/ComL family)